MASTVSSSTASSSSSLHRSNSIEPTIGPIDHISVHKSHEGSKLSFKDDSHAKLAVIHKFEHDKSILALAVHETTLYAGTQGGEIIVYDLEIYQQTHVLEAHHRNDSVLALRLSQSGGLLFSCGGDRFVDVWDTDELELLFCIYSDHDIGDIFCICSSSILDTIYFGAQDGSLQWYHLADFETISAVDEKSHPYLRKDAFFSSLGPGGVPTPPRKPTYRSLEAARSERAFMIPKTKVQRFAHNGYINSMLLSKGGRIDPSHEEILITGAGDGLIKVWYLDSNDGHVESLFTLGEEDDDSSPILCLALADTFLYSGHTEGQVNIWDLEARQHIRRIHTGLADVLTLSIGQGILYAACADGHATTFDERFTTTEHWKAHDGLVLSSLCTKIRNSNLYVTGGNDNTIVLWRTGSCNQNIGSRRTTREQLLDSLRDYVSMPTVSSAPHHQNDCRKAASYLRELLENLGASTQLLKTEQSYNPIVLAQFTATKESNSRNTRLLFYGHYDVVAADNAYKLWRSDPYTLTGVDGHLYGRGVSDNKGPVLAAIFAAADLFSEGKLRSDVVFVIEGEEEQGSRGFKEAIRRAKRTIGDIDWILLANSYWLDDELPCLTYGLRGVLRATISVQSKETDLHSGVDGSLLFDEPMNDLIGLMGRLTDRNKRVRIPGFYEPIKTVSQAEMEIYDELTSSILARDGGVGNLSRDNLTKSLMGRWREPTLTIHGFQVSGPSNPTIIPSSATATFSMRLVPNQDVDAIGKALQTFLAAEFAAMSSKNEYTLQIDHTAEPWLGDTSNKLFKTLERAVMQVWQDQLFQPSLQTESPSLTSNPVTTPKLSKTPHSAIRKKRQDSITSNTLAKTSSVPLFGRLASPNKPTFDSSTTQVQGTVRKPLYIREGGSIPAVRFLEKEFGAPAAHLPCGQASDNAHLDNERLRVMNLYKAKEVFSNVFAWIGE